MDIKTAISICIRDLSLSPNTALSYSKALRRFCDFLQEQGIQTTSDVTILTVDHFIDLLPWLDRQYSKGSVRVYGSAAKALLNWMLIKKHIDIPYLDAVRYKEAVRRSMKRRENRLPRWPARNDVPMMLEAVKLYEEDSPIKERNIALIEFLASTGCRNSEAINLDVKDIDFENRSTIVTGKGSKERRVWFSQSAADAIQLYWNTRNARMPNDPVFARHDKGIGKKRNKRMTTTTTRNIVKEIAIAAGIDPSKFSPHYFRHAFAIRVLSETHDLALVQDLLGHEDPKATRVYAKIYAEDLQDAHRRIFK